MDPVYWAVEEIIEGDFHLFGHHTEQPGSLRWYHTALVASDMVSWVCDGWSGNRLLEPRLYIFKIYRRSLPVREFRFSDIFLR